VFSAFLDFGPFFLAFSLLLAYSCVSSFSFFIALLSHNFHHIYSLSLSVILMSSSSVETGHETAVRIVRLIEQRVQKDEGNRGLDSLLHSSTNELYNAARSLLLKSNIAIITGFPCLIDYSPPTETDGPLGAVAIADLLLKLGKYVHILTDECNEEPVLSCVSQSGIFNVSQPHKKDQPSRLSLQSFPARTEFDEKDAERLSDVLE
jgi:hypothetical protein